MIQRVQTLFLIGVIICLGLMFVFPIWEKSNPAAGIRLSLDVYYLYEFKSADVGSNEWLESGRKPVYYLAGLAGIAALLALYVIFRYDKRTLQIMLNALNAFLVMVLIGAMVYLIYEAENHFGLQLKGSFRAGFFLPVGALVLISLSNRFIRKDEALVKSVDRIR